MGFLDAGQAAPVATVKSEAEKDAGKVGYSQKKKERREEARKAIAELRKLGLNEMQLKKLEVIAKFVEAQSGGGGFGKAGPSKFETVFGAEPKPGTFKTFEEVSLLGIAFSANDVSNLRKKGIVIEIKQMDTSKVSASLTGAARLQAVLATGGVKYVGPAT